MMVEITRRRMTRRDFLGLSGAGLAGVALTGTIGPVARAKPAAGAKVTWDRYSLRIGGRRVYIWSGEFHYWRLPSPDLWRDVLEKMKAAGFNAASIYFHWGYHSPKRGVYDFSGVRDVEKLLRITEEVGIWVIARPGPYINAETDSGGFPGWLTTIAGRARSTAPDYTAAYKEWLGHIDPILARHQITRGGSIILYQIENEFYDGSDEGRSYMQQIEDKVRADGIEVPLSGNHNATFSSGKGAVDIPGYDSYPQGFDASNPEHWNQVPDYSGVRATLPGTPLYFAEFQGGSFDPWGGAGYDKCRELTNASFEKVFYKANIASGATLQSFYMTYGGTSWGWLPFPGVYSSYDYGAAIDEARRLTGKYEEQKRLGYMVQSVEPLRRTEYFKPPAPENPSLRLDGRIDPASKTQFYVLRHADGTSTARDTTHISINLAAHAGYTYDDMDSAIDYHGSWTHASNQSWTSGDYQDTETYSDTTGDYAEVSFSGTGVRWISSKDQNHGIANVYLDGELAATVDTYATSKLYQEVLFEKSGLPSGEHTLRIEVTGRKNPASNGSYVVIDAIDIPPATSGARYYPKVPQEPGTTITVNGRDSKLFVINYRFGTHHLVYSTSELMTHASIGPRDVLLLYGRRGEDGETVLRHPGGRQRVRVISGSVRTRHDPASGDLRLDYTHEGLIRVLLEGRGRPLFLLIATDEEAGRFWCQETRRGTVLVRGPYLVRSAEVSGGILKLRGDTDRRSKIEVFCTPGIRRLSWNGEIIPVHRSPSGTLTAWVQGPSRTDLPGLSRWRFRYETFEKSPDFDDSGWGKADHTTTNNPNKPATLPVLYEDDYGFHHGDVWFRGRFTATGSETGITLDGEGGDHGLYAVWLNGTFLGSHGSGTNTFRFPDGVLRPGRENVLAVLLENMGHDEDYSARDEYKAPRGLREARLEGSGASLTWRIQGNRGGEDIRDGVRGPFNNGGLYGERNGWHLPGYPDGSWREVSLPHRFGEPGVAWYRTVFRLDLPEGEDVPVGLRFEDDPSIPYRVLVFLNGWLVGRYVNDLGPQRLFYLPEGLLDPRGYNTLALAVWNPDASGGGLGEVRLEPYGSYRGGVPVRPVQSPRYG